MRLNGKTALITGAARGIGRAIAELFHREGAVVILSDILDEEARSVVKSLGRKAFYTRLDVGKPEDWEAAMLFMKEHSLAMDILVNNAGITGFLEAQGPFDAENVSLESWKKVHEVNLDGVMLGCKHAIARMKENGGSIVNISSRSGIVGIPQAVAYASSKAAVRNHTKSVALYCAEKKYPIRCNSIHPAAIMTPMWDIMLGNVLSEKK